MQYDDLLTPIYALNLCHDLPKDENLITFMSTSFPLPPPPSLSFLDWVGKTIEQCRGGFDGEWFRLVEVTEDWTRTREKRWSKRSGECKILVWRERERGAKVAYLGRKKLRALGMVAEELECSTAIEERWWRQWKRCECRHSKVRFSWWLKMGIFWKIRRLHWD